MDVCISSWTRIAPNTLPALAKAGANYMNSQLIRMEAAANGYAEGIALDDAGYISEGSGENIFVIRDGKMLTPPLGASVLPGITRDTIVQIAGHLGIPVVETIIPRELVYIADEMFFTGTAVEVTPVRSVDRIPVGAGKRGPITEKIQKMFFDIVDGRASDLFNWLTPVVAVPETGRRLDVQGENYFEPGSGGPAKQFPPRVLSVSTEVERLNLRMFIQSCTQARIPNLQPPPPRLPADPAPALDLFESCIPFTKMPASSALLRSLFNTF